VAINAILAIGMTFVILSGGIDLSVGSVAGLCGIVAGLLISRGLVLPAARRRRLLPHLGRHRHRARVGMAAGAVNGWLVARLGVAPFIATLGSLYVARGRRCCVGRRHVPEPGGVGGARQHRVHPARHGDLLGLPVVVWLMAALAGVAIFVSRYTPFGRRVYAVGGNERAALLAGVRVARVKLLVYVISGLLPPSWAGHRRAARGRAPGHGQTFELNAIAAVVLGGTSLMGGRGTIGGTLIGAFVIGVLADGLVLLGVSEFWQMVIKGLVIVLAVILDQFQRRST
jgi:erythritol transport system permease protein